MSYLPKILIITAPSGAGKTSITKNLMEHFPQLSFSVSATTRNPRGNEQDGIDYYFINVEDFKSKIQKKEFAEWEMVYEGKYYGTLKTELKRIWSLGKVPILDIDVKGALHIRQQYPENTLSIFIEPPTEEALRERLLARGTETEDSLQTRLSKAAYEISFKSAFDKVVLNDNLQIACEEVRAVVGQFLTS
jgi:guanylate kinase